MLDAAAKTAGGRVIMVSSLDEDHSGDNVIDGDDRSYWISTGLFPQEVLLQLCSPCWVSSFKLATTHVRRLRLEGCHEDVPINFHLMAESDLVDAHGSMQVKEISCNHQQQPIVFIRLYILAGWHDFCSVHRLQVKGTQAPRSASPAYVEHDPLSPAHSTASTNSRMVRRAASGLHVDIPPTQVEHAGEPDAPRSTREPWKSAQASELLGAELGEEHHFSYEHEPLSPVAPSARK
mmetsp:Transcript_28450/g.52472  ORF Transcript_28450/g.52472 Transcript_28450/m.52472 type:complete len:235 (+) Transcript_28450:188-892(+)